MIGRDRELRRLRRLVRSAEPQVAIVAGEPGIGKTRLITELLAGLPADRVVLVGHAEPGSLSRPYEVLLDAVDGRAGVDADRLDALGDAARSPVERLHAGVDIVCDLVGDRPAVLVFEDLHWADSESTALFERIADLPGPRLLVGTYRPEELTSRDPAAALLDRLERRHTVTHVGLERFTESDTAALLAAATGSPLPFRTVVALHQRTGGNPFFLEELVRGFEGANLEEVDDQPLPWSLAEILRRQVDELDERTQRVVEAAAVLGHRVPFDLLATVAEVGEDELIGALRDLVARGVMVETGDDDFTFRHALVREAITGRLLGRQRRRLHEAALEALLSGGGSDPAMVAHHARVAGRYDDMVTAARTGAALYLSIGSSYQALRLAEMGLDEAPDDAGLLASAAQAAWLVGLIHDASGYAQRWRSHATTDAEDAEALFLMIRLAHESQAPDEMEALTRELERLVERVPRGPDQARAMTAIAQSAMLRDRIEEAVTWSDRALALADELDLPRVRLAALVEKGTALTFGWSGIEEGKALLLEVVEETEKLGEWVLAARALHNLVQEVPDITPAEHTELLERMRIDAERAGFESLAVASYYQGLARIAVQQGDLAGAIDALEQGRDRERGYQYRGGRADSHAIFLAGLYLEAGELDHVAGIIEAVRPLPGYSGAVVPSLAFHLACRRDEPEVAARRLDEVFEAVADQAWRSGSQAHDLVSAALHVGLPLTTLTRMRDELLDGNVLEYYRDLVDAQIAEASGDLDTAFTGYRTVSEVSYAPPSAIGTAHVGMARCLLAGGDREQAIGQVRAAAAALDRWAGWRVAQLAQVRARLGLAGDNDGAVSGPAALTQREREVALLVADGMTNAELARRLYISPKTAAVHVSSILRKLEVASRTEVAGALATR
ncbi:MAG: AAA family ATPase [Streptosporangiales bacterium]|nr:AAA family ATPase [Streptosporangiales bacterium]